MSSSIATFSGAYVDPLNFRVSDVDIPTIIYSLSNICRFNGHLCEFYSVAQHSVHVAERVMEFTSDRNVLLAALFHDASEAYLGDICSPLKHSEIFTQYRLKETQVQDAIHAALALPTLEGTNRNTLLRADLDLMLLEAKALGYWDITRPEWNGLKPSFTRSIVPLTPPQARTLFHRFLSEIQYGV